MTYRNKILIIFFAAILMRLIFSIGLFVSDQPLFSLKGDAATYIQTAKNFLEKGVWSSNARADLRPDNVRTPVYPLFLMFFIRLGIPFLYVVLVQDILMAISAVLIYALARKVFNDSVAFGVGIVWALEPYLASTFISKAIMTEPIAIFFLIISFFNLALFIKNRQGKNIIIGAMFLALSALTKPQFLYFSFFMIIAAIFAGNFRWKQVFFAYLVFLAILSPWLFYDFFILKTFHFSSVADLSIYVGADYFKQWKGVSNYLNNYEYPLEKAKRILNVNSEQLLEPENAKKLANMGKEIILKDPFSFAVYYIIHIPRLFWHDTTIDTITNDFGIKYDPGPGAMDVNVLKNILHFKFGNAFDDLSKHPVWLVSLFLKFASMILAVLAALNIFLKWRADKALPKVSLFFLMIIIAYALMMSPFGQQRYRAPIEPLILLLAFDSIRLIAFKKAL